MSRAKAVFIPPAELVVVARSSYPSIKAVHHADFPAWRTAFYYKYEESKKSFKVIPKPRQILSMVSTLS